MRFLSTLGGGGREVETKARNADSGIIRRASSGGPYSIYNTPYRSTWSPERAVTDGLEKVIWVYSCLNAIASDESRLPIKFMDGHPTDGEDVKPDDEPLWYFLNRRANPWESAATFRYRLSMQLLLSKQGVFVEVQWTKGKTIGGLYLLPPHRTSPIPDAEKFIAGYEVTNASGGIDTLEPERVLWIKRPHPLDPYMGLTPMEAAGLSIDTDFYARLFNRNFLQNDGRPGGIVNVKGYLDPADARELQVKLEGGPGRAGKVAVLESEGVEYVDTATSPRDSQYVQSRGITKEEILMAFGVPETRAGNASGRTYDNADAELEMYWRDTMRAHNDLIDEGFGMLTSGAPASGAAPMITSGTPAMFFSEDDRFCAHDTSSIDVLNRDERQKEERFQKLYDAGLITLDEFREATGREPLNRPGSRVCWIQTNKLPVGDEQDEKDALALASGQVGDEATEGGATPDGSAASPAFGAGDNPPGGGDGAGAFPSRSGAQPPDTNVTVDLGDLFTAASFRPDGLQSKVGAQITGGMVSIDVPRSTALELVGALGMSEGAEPPERLHLTLAYVTEDAAAEDNFTRDDLFDAVATFAKVTAPLALAVTGMGHFTTPGGTATYASIDSPYLPEFRQRLIGALASRGVYPLPDHGFTPHVTLAYTEPGKEPPFGDLPTPTFPVTSIAVHWGSDVAEFPLEGTPRPLQSLGSRGNGDGG